MAMDFPFLKSSFVLKLKGIKNKSDYVAKNVYVGKSSYVSNEEEDVEEFCNALSKQLPWDYKAQAEQLSLQGYETVQTDSNGMLTQLGIGITEGDTISLHIDSDKGRTIIYGFVYSVGSASPFKNSYLERKGFVTFHLKTNICFNNRHNQLPMFSHKNPIATLKYKNLLCWNSTKDTKDTKNSPLYTKRPYMIEIKSFKFKSNKTISSENNLSRFNTFSIPPFKQDINVHSINLHSRNILLEKI